LDDDQKLSLICGMLDIEDRTLNPDMELVDLENWDSIAVMSLLVMLKENGFNQKLDAEMIKKLRTIGDIMQLMSA